MKNLAPGACWIHESRDGAGLLTTLRFSCDKGGFPHLGFTDPAGRLFFSVVVAAPAATRAFDSTGREFLTATPTPDAAAASVVRKATANSVMMTGNAEGQPFWIIDDYANRARHFIFGCAPDFFLHAHLDQDGTVTITEKRGDHTVLRTTRRDATGRTLSDEVTVLPGERIDEIAARSGLTPARLRARYPDWSESSPPAGTIVDVG